MNHWLWRQKSRAAFRRLFSTECSQAFETCSCLSFSELHKYKAPCASTLSREFVWGLICFEHTRGFAKDSRIHCCTSSGAWLRVGSPGSCVGCSGTPCSFRGQRDNQMSACLPRFYSSFPTGSLAPEGFDLSKNRAAFTFFGAFSCYLPQIRSHCLCFAPTINTHRLLSTFFLHF